MSPATIHNNFKPVNRAERVSFQKYKKHEFFTDEPAGIRHESNQYDYVSPLNYEQNYEKE